MRQRLTLLATMEPDTPLRTLAGVWNAADRPERLTPDALPMYGKALSALYVAATRHDVPASFLKGPLIGKVMAWVRRSENFSVAILGRAVAEAYTHGEEAAKGFLESEISASDIGPR